MTPNLRYNKRMTAKLLKAAPKDDDRRGLLNIKWHLDNDKSIFGLFRLGWFKSDVFLLQKLDDLYRLVVPEKNGLCHFYIIDDIETFIDYLGIQELKIDNMNTDEVLTELELTKECPSTGIIVIDEERIYVYDHTNY